MTKLYEVAIVYNVLIAAGDCEGTGICSRIFEDDVWCGEH